MTLSGYGFECGTLGYRTKGKQMQDTIESSSNVMRQEYRSLTAGEQAQMRVLKDKGSELHALIESMGRSRELSLALTKVEEAVMWAVKHITR